MRFVDDGEPQARVIAAARMSRYKNGSPKFFMADLLPD